jgi:type I restriction enzyme S subunit
MSGWLERRFADLLSEPLRNGRSVPTARDGFPVLRLTAIKNGSIDLDERKTGAWTDSDARPYLVTAGDFMIARGSGSLALVGRGGLVRVEPDHVAFPDTMIRARPDRSRLVPEYLALVWESDRVRRQVERSARTSAGIYKVSQPSLSAVTLPVPPIGEQRRIVSILEEHLSDLDAAASSLRRASATCQALVTRSLSLVRSGKELPLPKVAVIQGGIQKQAKRAPRSNAFPFLRVANVTASGLDLGEVHQIELFNNELARYRLQAGDLLVVEGNGSPSQIGRAALWDGSIPDCVHQNHLIRVRPERSRVLPEYLEAVWNSPENRSVLTDVASSSSGLHTLSVRKLAQLTIPVPNLERQNAAVSSLREVRESVSRLQDGIFQAAARGKSLRRAVLAAAFSGRLTGYGSDTDVLEELAEQETA